MTEQKYSKYYHFVLEKVSMGKMKTFKETKAFIKQKPRKERLGYWLAYFKMRIENVWWRFKNCQFVNHISFLWHWKNFFFTLKYPFFRMYNRWSGKFAGYSITEYDLIPAGWQKAFGKQLAEDIKQAGRASRKRLGKHVSWKKLIMFEDIKEKFGELRLYASATEEIQHVLDKYSLLSTFYCIDCGKPARYVSKGWIEYYCKDCFLKCLHAHDEYREVPLTKDDENKALEECKLTIEDIPHITRYNDNIILVETFTSEEECRKKQKELYDAEDRPENMFYKMRHNDNDTWSLEHTESIKYEVDIEKEYNINFKELLTDEEENN